MIYIVTAHRYGLCDNEGVLVGIFESHSDACAASENEERKTDNKYLCKIVQSRIGTIQNELNDNTVLKMPQCNLFD